MSLKHLAKALYPAFLKAVAAHPGGDFRLFLSASDMKDRAIVRHASGTSPKQAWEEALSDLGKALQKREDPVILRADWVVEEESATWGEFLAQVNAQRRNYFRKGIALDPDYRMAFLEQELNGCAILYEGGTETDRGKFRRKPADAYCRTRFDRPWPSLGDASPVKLLVTSGVFVREGEPPLSITRRGMDSGWRDVNREDSALALRIAREGAAYLARQCGKNGKFIYGRYPCRGKRLESYNTLRHFGAIIALLEAEETYGALGTVRLRQAASRAVRYGISAFACKRVLPDGQEAAYFEDRGEIKLGANGIALVALAKYTELARTKKYIPLMQATARGILSMQKSHGGFVHVLNSSDFSRKETFRTVYYDGEAVLGLLRLYAITREEELVCAAERAFHRFIETDHWEYHDHWLAYATNELTKLRPKEEYFRFGIRNAMEFLPLIYYRERSAPTLLELMMATEDMLRRIPAGLGVDLDAFRSTLERRAELQMNDYAWPELAMYFLHPERVQGAFFARDPAFRARIDDTQHNVSGFIAYSRYLSERKPEERKRPPTVFWAGDAMIGRRMHWRAKEIRPLGPIAALAEADLRIVNLECVVSPLGNHADKGSRRNHYLRARPEQLNILVDADIDIVTTANNHSGDYGPAALLDQKHWLEQAGIRSAGSGRDLDEASRPVYAKAGELTIALFSVQALVPLFCASETEAGTWYLPQDRPEVWERVFREKITEARRHAHLVFVAAHWGDVYDKEPQAEVRTLGRLLIELGADAVLGGHTHITHGVETYRERPILYDAGNLLFDVRGDWGDSAFCGGFSLELTPDGVSRVLYTPLVVGCGHTERVDGDDAPNQIKRFLASCEKMGTNAHVASRGRISMEFHPPVRESSPMPAEVPVGRKRRIPELSRPEAEWTVPRIPEDAFERSARLGPFVLRGYRILPREANHISRMICIETYWSVDAPMEEDCRLTVLAVPQEESDRPSYGKGMDHDFCDWMWPTSRWKPSVIYRDCFRLRPSRQSRRAEEMLHLELQIQKGTEVWKYRDSQTFRQD